MEEIELVKYEDTDYNYVYELKKESYKKYVEYYYGTWDEQVQKEYFEKFINSEKENAYIIIFNKEKIGFYNGKILENEDYEIGNICIDKKYQGMGIGTKILKLFLFKNKNRNIQIQYFKINPVGKLYEKLGFEKVGETDFHIKMIKKNK